MLDIQRKVTLLPFEKARTVKVILPLDDSHCDQTFDFLISEAAKLGMTIHFIILNTSKFSIPQWMLKDNITVLNYKEDFTSSRMIGPTTDKICSGGCDMLISLAPKSLPFALDLALRTEANLKIGPDSGSGNPFDISLKFKRKVDSLTMTRDLINHLHSITGFFPSETNL